MRAVTGRGIVVQRVVRGDSVPSAARIRHWVSRALGGSVPGEVTVRVVDEAESARLNEQYRRGSGATDVLAFAYADSISVGAGLDGADVDLSRTDADSAFAGAEPVFAGAEQAFGDLVICAAVVEREAARRGLALEAHWAHICVHGALHLMGHDHEDDEQARVMEGRERELLEAMGFANPHAPHAGKS